MTRTLIGRGIVCWTRDERQSLRYGSLYLAPYDFDETLQTEQWYDNGTIAQFVGKWCKVTALVKEARPTPHCGDLTLKLPENPTEHIKPSQPNVGDEIVVGIGFLGYEPPRYSDSFSELVVSPKDDRPKFWLDPRTLYRLHNQTVEVFVEETDADPLPVTDLIDDYKEGTAYVTPTDEDQSVGIQTRMPTKTTFKIKPHFERLGDGLFMVKPPSPDDPPGTTYEIVEGE